MIDESEIVARGAVEEPGGALAGGPVEELEARRWERLANFAGKIGMN